MPNTAPDRLPMKVAAAVIVDSRGRCLLSYRSAAQDQGDCWEFPGGKVELGETAEQALVRELREELGIDVDVGELLRREQHDYSDKSVELFFYAVSSWRGEPTGREGQLLKWQRVGDLVAEQFPAGNRALLEQLQKPSAMPSS